MRLLYVAQMRPGGNGPERMQMLNTLGYTTLPFDVLRYMQSGNRLQRSIGARFNRGRAVARFNADLWRFARENAYDAVWIDKGNWLYPETLVELKSRATRHLAIQFTPDSQFHINRSRHFFACIPHYDLIVTSKALEVDSYRNAGANDVMVAIQGYGPKFRPEAATPERRKRYGCDVCFIGRTEPHYARILRAVKSTGVAMGVRGPNWPRYARFHPWARDVVKGPGLWGDDYPAALGSAKIALGLLTKKFPETSTTRTFEIPASGGFLLAERTAEHQSLFEEDREAVFFERNEELCDKLRYYVANESPRTTIAAAGRERCDRSRYDTVTQLRRIMEHAVRRHCVYSGKQSTGSKFRRIS